MNLVKDFDQMWQGHTTVYGAPKVILNQSSEGFGLQDVFGLTEEHLGSDGFKGVATTRPVRNLGESVGGLAV